MRRPLLIQRPQRFQRHRPLFQAGTHLLETGLHVTMLTARGFSIFAIGAGASVQTVAAAAEELSASVSDINQRATHSAQIANKAAEEATRADSVVQELNGTA